MGGPCRKKNGTKVSTAQRAGAGKTSHWDCKTWTLLLVPCLLWSTLPRMDDLLYLASFVMGQAMYYSINHMRGLLFLCFLVLFIWTKNVLIHWIHCKVLTMEFIRTLLFLMLSILMSIALLLGVWWPLWDCYDCAVAKMRPWIRDRLIYYKDALFIITAGSMAISATSQTDLFLKPNKISESGVPFMLYKIADKSSKLMRKAFKHICVIMEANWRTLTQLKGNKKGGFDMTTYVKGWACGDPDYKPKCDKKAYRAQSRSPRRVVVTSLRQDSDNKEDLALCPSESSSIFSSQSSPSFFSFPWWCKRPKLIPPEFPEEESGASVKKKTASSPKSTPRCKIAKCAASCSRPKEQIRKMTRSQTRATATESATSHLSDESNHRYSLRSNSYIK